MPYEAGEASGWGDSIRQTTVQARVCGSDAPCVDPSPNPTHPTIRHLAGQCPEDPNSRCERLAVGPDWP
jgi:hypothetical protein